MAKPRGIDYFLQKRPVILLAIREGLTFSRACQLCGVNQTTYRYWMDRGRKQTSGIYADFVQEVKIAMATAEQELVKIILAAARGGLKVVEKKIVQGCRPDGEYEETAITEKTTLPQWQPAAWILARRNAKQWGNESAIRPGGKQKEGNGLTPEEFADRAFAARQKMILTVPDPAKVAPVEKAEEPLLKVPSRA